MRALVLEQSGFTISDVPTPTPAAGEVRIALSAAALNHRDQYIRDGKYAKITLPCVLGSDGCGVVDMAPNEASHLLGQRVVIDPAFDWGNDPAAQGPHFSILGMPRQGTFAEFVCVPWQNVHLAPSHLTTEEAAALPLAGLTAYRSVMVQGAVKRGDVVLITGIGGGVATMAMQFALAAGASVWVTSGSDAKLERARELGAAGGANYNVATWATDLRSAVDGFDCIIDSVGGESVNNLTDLARAGGRLVFYGTSRGAVPSLNLHRIYWKQLHIVGSTMGTPDNFRAMLDVVAQHHLRPVVDSVYTLAHAEQAFERMKQSEQLGKIVLTCN
jgi:zinc-binding alcohol dehydrogenase/oxidoreductase